MSMSEHEIRQLDQHYGRVEDRRHERQIARLINALVQAQKLAHDVKLGNGGEIDSMLGAIIDDLESQFPEVHEQARIVRTGQ